MNYKARIKYYLDKAHKATSKRIYDFWMGKVDSARYFLARQEAKEKLAQRAKENVEAENRVAPTKASLSLERIVGNAVILKIVRGYKEAPGGYILIRRKKGETATEGYGRFSYPDHWVVQGLAYTIHEFAVVSEDDISAKQVIGPWLEVTIS